MWTPAEKLVIAIEDRRLLETWTRAHNAPQSVAKRCQVALLAADGLANNAIAKDRKSTRLNASHIQKSRMPSSA